jgi:hypothetical protein
MIYQRYKIVPNKDVPVEHKIDLVGPGGGVKPVDPRDWYPRDRRKDTFDEPDDIDVDVI